MIPLDQPTLSLAMAVIALASLLIAYKQAYPSKKSCCWSVLVAARSFRSKTIQ
jgi:hypothetical protein